MLPLHCDETHAGLCLGLGSTPNPLETVQPDCEVLWHAPILFGLALSLVRHSVSRALAFVLAPKMPSICCSLNNHAKTTPQPRFGP